MIQTAKNDVNLSIQHTTRKTTVGIQAANREIWDTNSNMAMSPDFIYVCSCGYCWFTLLPEECSATDGQKKDDASASRVAWPLGNCLLPLLPGSWDQSDFR